MLSSNVRTQPIKDPRVDAQSRGIFDPMIGQFSLIVHQKVIDWNFRKYWPERYLGVYSLKMGTIYCLLGTEVQFVTKFGELSGNWFSCQRGTLARLNGPSIPQLFLLQRQVQSLALGTCHPFKFFHFHEFLSKKLPNNRFFPKLIDWRSPPRKSWIFHCKYHSYKWE